MHTRPASFMELTDYPEKVDSLVLKRVMTGSSQTGTGRFLLMLISSFYAPYIDPAQMLFSKYYYLIKRVFIVKL